MTWIKWSVATVLVATVGLLWSALSNGPLAPPTLEAGIVEPETPDLAAVDPPREEPSFVARVEARDAIETEPPREEPVAAAAAPTTTIEIVEAKSGLPLAGVAVTFQHSTMERRLFLSRTKQVETEAATDEVGRTDLAVELDANGQSAGNPVFATIPVDPRGLIDVHCGSGSLQEDGTLRLEARTAAAFRVLLPEDLSDADAGSLTATLCVDRPHTGLTAIGSRLRPASVRGRDLVLLVPESYRQIEDTSGAVKLATTPTGPSFEATFERLPGLADAPLDARRSADVTHTFVVVDHDSGAPVPGAYVAVGTENERRASQLERVASGMTDDRGEVELIGVPQTDARVIVQEFGFEDYGSSVTPVAGGTTEIRLRRLPDLREVEVTIRPTEGQAPMTIWCKVSGGDGGTVHHETVEIHESRGSWHATDTLENVPSDAAFLEVYVYPERYDRVGPILIEPGTTELEVDLGSEVPLVQVVLDLPDDAKATYEQGARGRRFARYSGEHSGVSPVTMAPDDGRPVFWTVDAPGYVPVYGTERHWRRSTHAGRPCVLVAPTMERGWGALVRTLSFEERDGYPFQFRTSEPIVGATIHDAATGETLGVTDANGFAVITAEMPPARIEARYGGVTKSCRMGEARAATLGF